MYQEPHPLMTRVGRLLQVAPIAGSLTVGSIITQRGITHSDVAVHHINRRWS